MGGIDYDEFREQLASMYSRSRTGSRSGSRGARNRGGNRRTVEPRRIHRTRPMPPRPGVPETDIPEAIPIGEVSNVLWRKRIAANDLGLGSGNPQSTIRLNDGVRFRDSVLVRPYHDQQGNPISRNTYFRNVVFSGLDWRTDENVESSTHEFANATIRIFVLGEFCGEFSMRISHDSARVGVSSETATGRLPTTWLHTTPATRALVNDDIFVGGYCELCGQGGSHGPFELHFFTNPE